MLYFQKWKILSVFSVCFFGLLFALPNFLPSSFLSSVPSFMPHKKVNLGLDLQGGAHLLLQADLQKPFEQMHKKLKSSVRNSLRKKYIRYRDLKTHHQGVSVTLTEPENYDQAIKILKKIDDQYDFQDQGQGQLSLTLKPVEYEKYKNYLIEQSIEIVRRRVDEMGTKEPLIQKQGQDRILLQVPGLQSPDELKKLIGKTAKMSFHLVHLPENDENSSQVPSGYKRVPMGEDDMNYAGLSYVVKENPLVDGKHLVQAQSTVQEGGVVVSFRFDSVGAKKFARATQKYVGRQMAIVLDGRVISAPSIQSPILGGSGVITGQFTFESASQLALLLRSGALPTELAIIEERTVGPGLGQDSIDAGKISSIIAFSFVVIFMIAIYRLFGFFATIALVLNLILILACLSVLQATLTLPGIAGIVLTVGMAVDANVLIFERIKEELRHSRTPVQAIDAGYRRAIETILDANITTFIAAIFLFIFGSGPIKGFAVTLSIGILTSMFTAILFTRLQISLWFRSYKPKKLSL